VNLIDYVKKYNNKSFKEEKFNELDNLVFSQLVYLDFSNYKDYKTINEIGSAYLNENKIKDIKNYNLASKDSYILLKHIYNSKRYKDIHMYNYEYVGNEDTQFSAATFKINKKLTYVAFEGTDNLLIGWKEDLDMSYKYLVDAQKRAIEYLNKTISVFDNNVIIGGHSKGGNLALISSMYCNPLIRLKIKKIYNNDGPGLNLMQVNKFNKIKSKYTHIIPDYSFVGILLLDNDYKVVKSKRKGLQAHNIMSWVIDNNSLVESDLSNRSNKIKNSINSWLEINDYETRKIMIENMYQILDNSGIKNINDFKKIKNIFKIFKLYKNTDINTKNITKNFFKFNLKNILYK